MKRSEGTEAGGTVRKMLRLLLFLAPLLALAWASLLHLGMQVENGLRRLGTEEVISMVEPQPVLGALRVARGEALYQDYLSGLPVAPMTYGVLTYAAPGTAGALLDWRAPERLLLLGRAQATLGMLGVWAALFLLARQRGVHPLLALGAGLPLFWFPYLCEWQQRFAPDYPALAWSLAGWLALGPPGRRPGRGAMVAATLCWLAAFHYKPTYLTGQIAFAVERWVAIGRGARGEALRAVLPAAACNLLTVLASVLALQVATGGQWWQNTVASMGVQGPQPGLVIGAFGELEHRGMSLGILLPLCWALLYHRRFSLWGVYLLSLAVETLFLAKVGSNLNYYLGSIVLWGLLFVLQADRALGRYRAEGRGLVAFGGWSLLPVALALALYAQLPATFKESWEVDLAAKGEAARMEAILEGAAPEEVLVLDSWFALRTGRSLLFADSYHASLLEHHGLVDFGAVAERLRRGEYRWVLSNMALPRTYHYQGIFNVPPSLGRPVLEHYRLVRDAQGRPVAGNWLVLWEPRPVAAGEGAGDG